MAAVSFSELDGIDFGTVIDSTINAERTPLNILKQRQTYIQSRDSAPSSFSSIISTMESQASSPVSESMFTKATANFSNTEVDSATAGSEAISGTYSLQVDKMAKAQVTASTTSYSATGAIIADGGSISFTISATTTTSIDITAGTSLQSLQNSSNAQNSDGVLNREHPYSQESGDCEPGNMLRLYDCIRVRIHEGSTRRDCPPIEEAIKLLETLLSGWEEIARKKQKTPSGRIF